MTRLVSNQDMVALYNGLNELERIGDLVREEAASDKELSYRVGFAQGAVGEMHNTIHSLRDRILQWSKLRPLADGTEIIESTVVGECSTHGLFFCTDRRVEVKESECPACAQEEDRGENEKMEAADAKHDAAVDGRPA